TLDEELRHFLAEVDPDPQRLGDFPEDAAEAAGTAADVPERRRFSGLLVRSADGRIAIAQRERVATYGGRVGSKAVLEPFGRKERRVELRYGHRERLLQYRGDPRGPAPGLRPPPSPKWVDAGRSLANFGQ